MSRISRPIFTVYSAEDNSLDDTPDLRPVVYVASLHPGVCAGPHGPHLFGFDPTQHETKPDKPFGEAAPWLADCMPQQGHADQRERSIGPMAGYSRGDAAGIDRSNALRSVSLSEPQASPKVAAIANNRTGDADGHAVENFGCASSFASPSSGLLSSIAHGLIGLLGRWQRRREVSRSIAALSRLNDRTLRDIGIDHRLQIPERVRFEP
jgi:uncharacterized protein YjiS (DUF1127 family)